jgi:DNA-binding transcriptional ArsR family regulator
MEEPPLDEYCKKILAILLLLRKKTRFNELYRFLNQHGVKISKPTLSEHLKHLTKLKILVRRKEGIQKVTYRINFERFEKLDESSELTQDIVTRHFQQEKMYKSLPVSRKIDLFHTLTILQSLMLLKLEILSISNPDKKFEYSLSHYSTVQHFGTIRTWLLDNLRENPEELEQATKELIDVTDRYMGILFEPKKP